MVSSRAPAAKPARLPATSGSGPSPAVNPPKIRETFLRADEGRHGQKARSEPLTCQSTRAENRLSGRAFLRSDRDGGGGPCLVDQLPDIRSGKVHRGLGMALVVARLLEVLDFKALGPENA